MGVLSIALGTFVLVTSEFLPIALLSSISQSLDLSKGVVGLTVMIPGLIAAGAAPALAMLAGRLNRKTVLTCLTLLTTLSNLIVALAPNLTWLLVGRIFLGVAVGGFWTFSVAAGRRLVDERSGARATALISAGISIGTVLGVPAGAQFGGLFGWRAAFFAVTAFGLVVLLAQLWLLPSLVATRATTLKQLFGLFCVPRARIGLLAVMLVAGGQFTAYTYLEPFLRQVPGIQQTTLTTMLFIYGFAGIAGTFLGEAAANKNVRRAFIGASLLLGATLVTPAFSLPSISPAYVFVGLWGLAFGAVPVCIQIWMYQTAPAAYEGGSALFVAIFQLALAAGALGGGLLVDSAGLTSAMVVGGVLCLATTVVIFSTRHSDGVVERCA
jgi:predicted MFS family arabinose efflux permease